MGGTVVYKELSEPIFLSTLNDKSLIVVSAIGRYPFLLSTDGLLNNLNEPNKLFYLRTLKSRSYVELDYLEKYSDEK